MTRAEPGNPAEDMLFVRHIPLLPPWLLPLLPISPTVVWQPRVLEETKTHRYKMHCLTFSFSDVSLLPCTLSEFL